MVRRKYMSSPSTRRPLPPCPSEAAADPSRLRDRRPIRPGRLTPGSAARSAVELLPEDVRVSGVPRGLARHVGHDPPERVPVAVDRDDETRFRIADGTDRAVAVLDCCPVVPQHVGRSAVGGYGHAALLVDIPGSSDEVVA